MASKASKKPSARPSVEGGPKPKFQILGKSKFVHVVRTKAWDLKHSPCQQVRKFTVAEIINYKKGLSPEAASALEPCFHCDTTAVIKTVETPEQRKAEAKAKRDEMLDKIAAEQTKTRKNKAKQPKQQAAKEEKPKKVVMTKSGPRSLGGSSEAKAQDLADFAKQHGWSTAIKDGEPGVLLVATRDNETIRCWFIDGKYDASRDAVLTAGSWQGKLRGAHGCRRQMSGVGRDRPHPNPGQGRSVEPRKRAEAKEQDPADEESPADAKQSVPFLPDDDDIVIIDAVKGKMIYWRNGVSGVREEAWLPSKAEGKKRDKIKITAHPKTGRRMISFLTVESVNEHGEVYGAERSVYIDKIVKVKG